MILAVYSRISKRIAPSGTGQDLNLNNSLFIIFAHRITPSSQLNTLDSHAVDGMDVRGVSANRFAIATEADNPSLPVRAPEDYRIRVTSPDGCSRSSCDLFIGIDTNTGDNRYIDIYMEGTAAGWIAVGFSDTPNMVGTGHQSYVRKSFTRVKLHLIICSFRLMWCRVTDLGTVSWP